MSQLPDFDTLRAALYQLNLDQARQLYTELEAILHQSSSADVKTLEHPLTASSELEPKRREVVETQRIDDRLYQLERVRCGKVGCKCGGENGELHGPYWYAYWRDEGKLKSRYVGKRLRQLE